MTYLACVPFVNMGGGGVRHGCRSGPMTKRLACGHTANLMEATPRKRSHMVWVRASIETHQDYCFWWPASERDPKNAKFVSCVF